MFLEDAEDESRDHKQIEILRQFDLYRTLAVYLYASHFKNSVTRHYIS